MLICKMKYCPYYKDDFCTNRLPHLDKNGMCYKIWENGQQRATATTKSNPFYTTETLVREVSFTVAKDEEEEEYHQISLDEYMAAIGQNRTNN